MRAEDRRPRGCGVERGFHLGNGGLRLRRILPALQTDQHAMIRSRPGSKTLQPGIAQSGFRQSRPQRREIGLLRRFNLQHHAAPEIQAKIQPRIKEQNN